MCRFLTGLLAARMVVACPALAQQKLNLSIATGGIKLENQKTSSSPVPFHREAIRFYREKGVKF